MNYRILFMTIQFFLVSLLALVSFTTVAKADDEGDDEAMAIAHRYGMHHFDQIDEAGEKRPDP